MRPGSLVPDSTLLLGSSFLCGGRGLASGLASALLLEELSLLSSDSSLGISSQNLWEEESLGEGQNGDTQLLINSSSKQRFGRGPISLKDQKNTLTERAFY